ncbi:MAG: UvrD-helicase domain-containing protein [Anaerolineales bacterium]|nr:UvrD-helicase domain-containing protein [Anaerolineales bacterium]
MKLLDELNPQQRQAVTALPGPVLVLAGPGSGKTRVLTHRIGFLIANLGIRPSEIMAVTFTNKAAREMRSRVEKLLGGDSGVGTSGISLGTFHSFCARMIRREADQFPVTRDFVIFDESDQITLMRQVLKRLNTDPKQIHPTRVRNAISSAKNELISPDVFAANNYFNEVARRAYEDYQHQLLESNALDFDDLLFLAVRILQEQEALRQEYRRRYPHILVDEFQDTNTAQYSLLRLLAGDEPDLFVVGDPDQSIYRWRGADYRNVLRFQEDYPQAQTFLLEQNYRSTQNILDAAMGVIDKHPGRQRKRLFTDHGPGPLIKIHEAYDEVDEANTVVETIAALTLSGEAEPGDCAVMYRTNAQSRVVEEAFLRAGLPYKLVGAQYFYGRREVKDIIAYLRLVHNPEDQLSLLRVLNVPPRSIGNKTIAALIETAEEADLSPGKILLDLAMNPASPYREGFKGRAAIALTGFGEMLTGWIELSAQGNLASLIDRVLIDTDYRAYIDDGSEEGEERWENVLELKAVADEYEELGLTLFLEHVALISDQDTLTEAQNAPTLLTLHAAKGLEFPVVFIIGLDDGMIPHQRSFDDGEAMAEERRLFYVGVTRAMTHLILVRAFRRRVFGTSSITDPSGYLEDLPADLLEGDYMGIMTSDQAAYQRQTDWRWKAQSIEVQPQFRVGMRVRHSSFGEGIVMESRIEQDDEEVTIAFESFGIKVLAASLANLETLED